jgi:hypothetical protein
VGLDILDLFCVWKKWLEFVLQKGNMNYMLISNKERISATITSSLVSELRKITKGGKKTQSSIIEEALRFWMNNKLAKDAKELANINFDDLPTEEKWLALNPNSPE